MHMLRTFESVFFSQSRSQLMSNLRLTVQSLGFHSFYYGTQRGSPSDASAELVVGTDLSHVDVMSDYPVSWGERYSEASYVEVDPLVRMCSRSIVPTIWHRLPDPNWRSTPLFDEARQHGLANGMTCSVIGGKGELALLSLTVEKDRQSDRRMVERQLSQGHLLMSYLHEAFLRLNQPPADKRGAIRLTAREREVLTWVCAGKTSWEIARILALAERTVVFHIDNAMRKLDTKRRSQAVARALNLGLISP
jgi:DNA-binding CsgD family transcriptional regulator